MYYTCLCLRLHFAFNAGGSTNCDFCRCSSFELLVAVFSGHAPLERAAASSSSSASHTHFILGGRSFVLPMAFVCRTRVYICREEKDEGWVGVRALFRFLLCACVLWGIGTIPPPPFPPLVICLRKATCYAYEECPCPLQIRILLHFFLLTRYGLLSFPSESIRCCGPNKSHFLNLSGIIQRLQMFTTDTRRVLFNETKNASKHGRSQAC